MPSVWRKITYTFSKVYLYKKQPTFVKVFVAEGSNIICRQLEGVK